MVTTRRGPPAATEDRDSSDASIPARPVRRRAPTGTAATLRPSREPTIGLTSPVKRKRGASAPLDLPQRKRRRQGSEVRDSIEVQGEDDDVDAAISATSTRNTSTFEILLPSVRRPRGSDERNSTRALSTRSAATTTARPLGARRLNRHINSVEITGGFLPPQQQRKGRGNTVPDVVRNTPERGQGEEEVPAEYLGSPELQSSALKRRLLKPLPDVYDIPEDEDAEAASPAPIRPPITINGLGLHSRLRRAKRPGAALPTPQQSAGFSSSRKVEQAPRRNQASREAPPGVEGRELVRRANNDEGDNQEESEEREDTETETRAGESPSHVARRPEFAGVRVRPYDPSQPTITVFGDHLNNMSEIMGRRGWTGAGRRWRADFSVLDFGDEPPARTPIGESLFTSLNLLKDHLDDVPNAMDLAGQSRFLADHQQYLRRAMARIDGFVNRIKNLEVRSDELVEDLSACIIPMLVLVLRTAFAMGAKGPDAEVSDRASAEGVFTWTTVQYLMFTLGWTSRLHDILISETNPRAGDDADPPAPQPQDPENEKQNRERFGVMVKKWKEQLKEGVNGFNQQADVIRRRYEQMQKDARIRAARRQQEDEEFGRAGLQETAFAASIRYITSQPRPMAEKFRKALQQSVFSPPRSSHAASTQSRSSYSSNASRLLLPPAPAQQRAPPPPAMDYPPWPEDEVQWFLDELTRPNRRRGYLEVCAETLERPLAEVRMEKERLTRLGLYRSPSRGG